MNKAIRLHNYIYKYSTNAIIIIGIAAFVSYLLGIRAYCVKTGSMGDAVPVGSICFVSKYYQYENITPGEIIAFNTGENMRVTHRAVKVSDQGITTRGDSNNVDDPELVTKDNFIGRTLFSVPYIGYLCEWLHTKHGLIVGVLTIVLIQLSGFVYNRTSAAEGRKADERKTICEST